MSGRVLITGSGSGLGRELAIRYARAGWRVAVSDVDANAAAAVAGELGAEHVTLDVTDEESWAAARDWCETVWGGLDVLINNAGVGSGGRIERTELSDWDWIWQINVRGVVAGCHTFVPLFKARRSGHIVNIASLAAIMNLPGMASYNATKAAVLSLSETLHQELRPYGIRTTVVCPGFFQTNLGDRMRVADTAMRALSAKLMASSEVSAAAVADQVFDAVAGNRFLVLTHRDGRRSHRLKRLLPRAFDAQVAKYWARLRPAIEKDDA